tara:strand:+ start:425 stop:583 length:159 start_codon:yes stop_codon:yes gene_type:complete
MEHPEVLAVAVDITQAFLLLLEDVELPVKVMMEAIHQPHPRPIVVVAVELVP